MRFAAWLLAALCAGNLRAADASAILAGWLAAQPGIRSLSSDFRQTRALKTLTQPLVTPGHLFFQAPGQFRWELGNPALTIALKNTNEMLVVYPKLHRAERYPATDTETGPWRDALALLEAGFPRDQREFEARFKVLSAGTTNDTHTLALEPKSAAARRFMPRITIVLDAKDYGLRATELVLADGSTMRNDFINPIVNPPLDAKTFDFPLDATYTVTEPLKRK